MSQTQTPITCPSGHTFPYEQLTTRDGLYICPVCDRARWSTTRTWSHTLLAYPLLLLIAAIVMFVVETISGIGLGTTYQTDHVASAAWLTAGSSVSLAGIVGVGVGVAWLVVNLRSRSWSRQMLWVPLLVGAGGLAVVTLGYGLELGLNVAFLGPSGFSVGQ